MDTGSVHGRQSPIYTILPTIFLLASLPGPATAGSRPLPPPVAHAETIAGEILESRFPDREINPASVVKVATTLWALDALGAEHRFTTRFGIRGSIGAEGRVEGDLVVTGGADPDFHVENAYLVARALNRAGIFEVSGRVIVDDHFWIGWEGGSERRKKDPRRRAESMASAFRAAIDPSRWSDATREALTEFRGRRGLEQEPLPRVEVRGGTRGASPPDAVALVVHRSNPLRLTLKRLNAYSNNDIERLGASLGDAGELARYLGRREIRANLESLSGLGRNRMTCRGVTTLLRALRHDCDAADLSVADLLPVTGCDPGTLESYPVLSEGALQGSVTAKTGSLTQTDGGVAVLAGFLRAARGESVFCVARPGIGDRLPGARSANERWLLELAEREGGRRAGSCGASVVYSDDQAIVELSRASTAR